MLSSRRSRSRQAGATAARRSGGGIGWRPGRRGGSGGPPGGRWLAVGLTVAALVGAGYGLGLWRARRAGSPSETALPAAPVTAAPAPTLGPQRPEPPSSDSSALDDPAYAPPSERASESAPMDDRAPSASSTAGTRPTIAIVIDDLGRSLEMIDQLRGFGVALTYAVLPFESRTAAVAARLVELGEEFLCHLPMEAQRGVDPGPGALDGTMDAGEIRATTRRALAAVPGATGINNHMGSALSEDRVAMTAMLDVVSAERLFFLDSRTSPASVAYSLARDRGVPAAERKVFLDGDRKPRAIRREFRRLLALADAGGPAIAIGHPYPETLAVLAEEIPRAQANGYRFIRVSEAIAKSSPEAPDPGQ